MCQPLPSRFFSLAKCGHNVGFDIEHTNDHIPSLDRYVQFSAGFSGGRASYVMVAPRLLGYIWNQQRLASLENVADQTGVAIDYVVFSENAAVAQNKLIPHGARRMLVIAAGLPLMQKEVDASLRLMEQEGGCAQQGTNDFGFGQVGYEGFLQNVAEDGEFVGLDFGGGLRLAQIGLDGLSGAGCLNGNGR